MPYTAGMPCNLLHNPACDAQLQAISEHPEQHNMSSDLASTDSRIYNIYTFSRRQARAKVVLLKMHTECLRVSFRIVK